MIRNIFDFWNEQKKSLDNRKDVVFYVKPREIWFVKMGKNIGFEEDGKDDFLRPVLVLKKIGNLFFTVALTSKGKFDHFLYHKFAEITLQNPKHKNSSYAILSQVKVMDKRRFIEHVGYVSDKEFQLIKQKLRTLLL